MCGTPDRRADVWSPASARQDQHQEGVQNERAGSGRGVESAFNTRETAWRHDARGALPCNIPALSPASTPCTPEPHHRLPLPLPLPLPFMPAAHTQQGTDSHCCDDVTLCMLSLDSALPLPFMQAAHTQQGTDSHTRELMYIKETSCIGKGVLVYRQKRPSTDSHTPRHLQADTTLGRGRTMQEGGGGEERIDHWRACLAGAEAWSSSSSQDSWTRDGFSCSPNSRGKRAFQAAI